MDLIKANNVSKSFDGVEIIRDMSFSIKKGDCVAIVGPSGVGKTTLLRSLVKLEEIDGVIEIEKNIRIGMVFQSFNLFPHMSVTENLIFGSMKVFKIKKEIALKKAYEILKLLKIENKKDSMPAQLSGGEKQRVAIARELMMNPDVLLFDEPTSALDFEMRDEVGKIIKELNNSGITIIFVSHDMDFVKQVAKKVIKMEKNKKSYCTKNKNLIR